jgi:hemerythrin-like domain-containing protein
MTLQRESQESSMMSTLLAEHDAMKELIEVLELVSRELEYLANEARAQAELDWPRLRARLFDAHEFLRVELPRHHAREEQLLFARLLPRLTPNERSVVLDLTLEHAGLERLSGALVAAIAPWLERAIPPDELEEVLRVLELGSETRAHLEEHCRTEELKIYPLAVTALTPADLEELSRELAREAAAIKPPSQRPRSKGARS